MNATLVTVSNSQVGEAVRGEPLVSPVWASNFYIPDFANKASTQYHIGLYYDTKTAAWWWTNGSRMGDYVNWEPIATVNSEWGRCVRASSDSGYWVNEDCGTANWLYGICEMKPSGAAPPQQAAPAGGEAPQPPETCWRCSAAAASSSSWWCSVYRHERQMPGGLDLHPNGGQLLQGNRLIKLLTFLTDRL